MNFKAAKIKDLTLTGGYSQENPSKMIRLFGLSNSVSYRDSLVFISLMMLVGDGGCCSLVYKSPELEQRLFN